MAKVTFMQENGEEKSVFAASGEILLEIARKANVPIDAPCSGNGSCGKCVVRLAGGALSSEKTRHITDEQYKEGYRLACLSKVEQDVKIILPDIASAYKSRMKVTDLSSGEEEKIFQTIKKEMENSGLDFINSFKSINVDLQEPSLDDTMPDNERLIRKLKELLKVEAVKIPFYVLAKMPEVLRESNFNVNCIIECDKEKGCVLYNILPLENTAVVAGLAVDIGTTSVSALAVDLSNGKILAKASAGNGQIRYGADVINRIIESTKKDGKKKLKKAIVEETLNPMVARICESAGINKDDIVKICIASNTTMNHLLFGLDADPIRKEPYIPAFFDVEGVEARDLELGIHPNAKVIVAPNIGSYVGGDITAGTLTSMIWDKPEMSLFIDLGTNGEIVFGNNDFLMSCACSAGPAFEGGDISCGMRATDGAIEACTIDEETLEPSYKIIGESGEKPVGVCGSGIIDLISELFRCKIINSKGLFAKEGKRIVKDEFGSGSYIVAFKEEAGGIKDVAISEVDIDNFIRAKGAIFSAIKVLMESLEMEISLIEKVYVAGGIGSGINIKNAIRIGMFPDLPLENYQYIGNSSLTGAYSIVMSDAAREKVVDIAKNMTYVELSTNSQYMDEFVAACFIPHTDSSLFSER